MMRKPNGQFEGGTCVEKLLEEQGPMTMREIAEQLNVSVPLARSYVSYTKSTKKTIYVTTYRREVVAGHLYPRAVYALGTYHDAPKPPKLTKEEYTARHYAKKRKFVSSVFQLGTNTDARRTTTRKRPDLAKQPVADA